MTYRMDLIRLKFDDLIRDAEAELSIAEREHAEALDMMPTPDDPEEVAYVTELRAETGAEVFAAKAVADALVEAQHEVLYRAGRGMTRQTTPAVKHADGKIIVPCQYCGKQIEYEPASLTAQGVFNSFCADDDCEDRFAATL